MLGLLREIGLPVKLNITIEVLSWKNEITFGKIQGINEIAFQILTCTQRRRLVFNSKNKCNS